MFGVELKILVGSLGLLILSFLVGTLQLHWTFLLVCWGAMYGLISLKFSQVTEEITASVEEKRSLPQLERANERVEWMNRIIQRVWFVFRERIATEVVNGVNPAIEQNKPGFIKSITFPVFDLGNVPPYIIFMKGYKKTGDNKALIDLNIAFNNPKAKIVVSINFGFISIPIEVRDLVFEGYVRVEVTFQPSFPYIKEFAFCFLERPYFDFGVAPFKAVDLFEIAFLHLITQTVAYGVLDSMLIDPYIMKIDLNELMNADSTNGLSKGVLVVTLIRGEKFPKMDFIGACDPYVKVVLGNQEFTSATCSNTLEPIFKDKFYFLLSDAMSQKMEFSIFDYNSGIQGDELIHKHAQDLSMFQNACDGELYEPEKKTKEVTEDDAAQAVESGPVIEDIVIPVRIKGSLYTKFEFYKSPPFASAFFESAEDQITKPMDNPDIKDNPEVLQELKEENLEMKKKEAELSKKIRSGLMRIGIHEVRGIDDVGSWGASVQLMVEVLLGKVCIFTTPGIKDELPIWNSLCEALIQDYRTGSISFRIVKFNPKSKSKQELATCILDMKSVIGAGPTVDHKWYPAFDNKDIELALSLEFAPMNFGTTALEKLDSKTTSKMSKALPFGNLDMDKCGIVNVTIHEARNLMAADSNGKSDPFVVIKVGDKTIFKTQIKKKTLNPIWEESTCFPVPSLEGMKVHFFVRDWDRMSQDDPIGDIEVDLASELGSQGEDLYEGWIPLDNGEEGEIKLTICYDPPLGATPLDSVNEESKGELSEDEDGHSELPSSSKDHPAVAKRQSSILRSKGGFGSHGKLMFEVKSITGLEENIETDIKAKLNGKTAFKSSKGLEDSSDIDISEAPLQSDLLAATLSFRVTINEGIMHLMSSKKNYFESDELQIGSYLAKELENEEGVKQYNGVVSLKANPKADSKFLETTVEVNYTISHADPPAK